MTERSHCEAASADDGKKSLRGRVSGRGNLDFSYDRGSRCPDTMGWLYKLAVVSVET
jgi:hypothetical protein